MWSSLFAPIFLVATDAAVIDLMPGVVDLPAALRTAITGI